MTNPHNTPPKTRSLTGHKSMKITALILSLSLYAIQLGNAALVFTFADNGAGSTSISVSGGSTSAFIHKNNTWRNAEGPVIGVIDYTSHSLPPLIGFGDDVNGYTQSNFVGVVGYTAFGNVALSDTLSLGSTGMTNNPALITHFQAGADGENFGFIMNTDANYQDTLSAVGDLNGVLPVNYDSFSVLWGESLVSTNDEWVFVFTAVPEPSSAALLGLGGVALILRRRK